MTRRALPSDPLHLLRESVDVAPPEGAEGRIALRLANLAAAGSAAGAVSAVEPTGRPSWGVLGRRFLRWSVTPLGVGIAIGAGGQALIGGSPGLHPQPSLPSVPVSQAPPTASASLATAEEPTTRLLDASPTRTPPSAQLPRSTLVDERVLLDRARRQLASGEPARALVFLEQHAQRFGRGELTEEREAMRINVLVQLGRKDEAKSGGEAFAERFPNSIMGASVRSALQAAEGTK